MGARAGADAETDASPGHTLWASITQRIFTLPEPCLLHPGHDYTGRSVTSLAEEKAFNTRLGGTSTERDFVGHMEAAGPDQRVAFLKASGLEGKHG